MTERAFIAKTSLNLGLKLGFNYSDMIPQLERNLFWSFLLIKTLFISSEITNLI